MDGSKSLLLSLSNSTKAKEWTTSSHSCCFRTQRKQKKAESTTCRRGFRAILAHAQFTSRTGTFLTRSTISFQHSSTQLRQYGRFPLHPPGFSWSLLLTFSTVRHCQIFCASALGYHVMARSAASTIPRCQFPIFLAALGHSTVSTPNSRGELSVDPSVSSNTLKYFTRHWTQSFSGRPQSRVHSTSGRPEHHAMGQSLIARPL